MATVRHIPSDKLFVSEPNPMWFGNGGNTPNDPAWTSPNWLKSRFHFSFAEYHNRDNSQFGVLRVMNDDLVQPKRGFGTHSHSNMEIITYIVEGQLTHKDSMGTSESLGRGGIQFMTAGTGIHHSEFNLGDKPLRFIQTWIMPAQANLDPNYGSFAGDQVSRRGNLHHLVSSVKNDSIRTPVEINQDLDTYAAELEIGQEVSYELAKGRQAYLLCVEGTVKVNDVTLRKYDASEISTTKTAIVKIDCVDVETTETGNVAHILMFVMKAVPDAGRSDF